MGNTFFLSAHYQIWQILAYIISYKIDPPEFNDDGGSMWLTPEQRDIQSEGGNNQLKNLLHQVPCECQSDHIFILSLLNLLNNILIRPIFHSFGYS